MFEIPNYALKCLETLENNGFESYIVGGCVRDFCMKRTPHDFDITTNAKPEQVKECFKEYNKIDIGEKHGTVAIIIDDEQVEITTYRIDGDYKDSRHPQNVIFSEKLNEDLSRRDFTVNAMAMNKNHEIVDIFGGMTDIENKFIRTVGNPVERFTEDALRIMRALRFSSQLDFEIEKETSKTIHNLAYLLKNISVERIREEFLKLICGKRAVEVLREYCDVIEVFIPEITSMYGFDQLTPYHKYDVWEHTLKAIGNIVCNPILRMTMFLHDIAKPDCLTIDKNGQGHFKGHALLGSVKAEKILKRLKFSVKNTKEIVTLIENHRDSYDCDYDVKCMMNKIGADLFKNLLDVKSADDTSKGFFFQKDADRLAFARKRFHEIIENNECYRISDLKINGNDILNLGFSGKEVGKILNELLDKVFRNTIENDYEILINYANSLKTIT